MKNLTKCAKIVSYNEGGVWLHAYDDANDNLIHPGYVCKGNPTASVGIMLDAAGLAVLKAAGCPDPHAVLAGTLELTKEQAEKAFELYLPKYVQLARASFDPGVFDSFSEARQASLVDMAYNCGYLKAVFYHSIPLLNEAQKDKLAGHTELAHDKFLEAAHGLSQSSWYNGRPDRAQRDIEMLVSGNYVEPFVSM